MFTQVEKKCIDQKTKNYLCKSLRSVTIINHEEHQKDLNT